MNDFNNGDKVKIDFEYMKGEGVIVKKFTKHQYLVKITESNSFDYLITDILLFGDDILTLVG